MVDIISGYRFGSSAVSNPDKLAMNGMLRQMWETVADSNGRRLKAHEI